MTLMEDAMLIHRIMRAPEKRMFYINVGAIPPNEVEQFMQKTINSIKKTPYKISLLGEIFFCVLIFKFNTYLR